MPFIKYVLGREQFHTDIKTINLTWNAAHNNIISEAVFTANHLTDLIEQGLTSPPTQYRLSGRRFWLIFTNKTLQENTETKYSSKKQTMQNTANETTLDQSALWHSTRKRDELILQRFWANVGQQRN